MTIAQTLAATEAAQRAKRHLSNEERAALLNMAQGDLNRVAEMLACLAGLAGQIEPDLSASMDLKSAVFDASRLVRQRAQAEPVAPLAHLDH